jgi:hypothetical protein
MPELAVAQIADLRVLPDHSWISCRNTGPLAGTNNRAVHLYFEKRVIRVDTCKSTRAEMHLRSINQSLATHRKVRTALIARTVGSCYNDHTFENDIQALI